MTGTILSLKVPHCFNSIQIDLIFFFSLAEYHDALIDIYLN
jgi:hypothetical protein